MSLIVATPDLNLWYLTVILSQDQTFTEGQYQITYLTFFLV